MNKAILLLGLIAMSAAVKWTRLDGYTFDKYKTEYSKRYLDSEEEKMRQQIFESELGRVQSHNVDKTKTWKEGINHFSDRTEEEKRVVLGLNSDHLYSTKENRDDGTSKRNRIMIDTEDISLPREVDWRQSGIISSVKDQGDCGSCWSFAAAETVEAYMALQSGFLSDLSQQQILECTQNPLDCGGDGGCGGGTVELAWGTIRTMGGLSTEWTYPYTAYHGDVIGCQTENKNGSSDGFTPVVKILNYTVLPSNELAPVMQHIATTGPLAISVDASSWFAYESGVYNGCNQTNPDLDHAVQLVGYGVDQINGPYWLVRNSWNPSWGEQGYIRLFRETSDADVLCGLDIKPLDGDGCKADPTPEKVCGTCGILYDNVYPVVESIWK